MTALEMLEKLQADCRWLYSVTANPNLLNMTELQPIIDKLREEQHKHMPGSYTDCCSCGWHCAVGSNRDECARQHAKHVKEQK